MCPCHCCLCAAFLSSLSCHSSLGTSLWTLALPPPTAPALPTPQLQATSAAIQLSRTSVSFVQTMLLSSGCFCFRLCFHSSSTQLRSSYAYGEDFPCLAPWSPWCSSRSPGPVSSAHYSITSMSPTGELQRCSGSVLQRSLCAPHHSFFSVLRRPPPHPSPAPFIQVLLHRPGHDTHRLHPLHLPGWLVHGP